MEPNKKRNKPIATLIRDYINKKSGKVVQSREEIKRRFGGLDWKDQKKIINAFLASGKCDREWAYLCAYDNWDKSFEPKIRELWEKYYEERSSWPLIHYASEEFLVQNIDKFTDGRDYYFLCLRLAQNKNFEIDKNRLSLTDYLSVIWHTNRNIGEDEARDILFQIVREICVECFSIDEKKLSHWSIDVGVVICPSHSQPVSLALYYLKKLQLHSVISVFEKWDDAVEKLILASREYKQICNLKLNNHKYKLAAMYVTRKYAYLNLDAKYKTPNDPDADILFKKFIREIKYY